MENLHPTGVLADDYTAWNNAAPTWNGTLAVAASRWYGAKTQGGSRVALAANNTTITVGQTSAVAYVGQTNCTVDYCSQISQRLYYTCAACPSAGSELPVPDTPTADGISFYGATSEYGVLSGDHGTALTGSPTLKSGATQVTASAIPSFALNPGDGTLQTYIIQFASAPLGATFKIYPKEQTGIALNSVTPTGGLPLTIISNSSSGGF